MPYESSGSLTTDEREVNTSTTWDTQTDWEAFQSASNIAINNGAVELAETAGTYPSSVTHAWPISEGSGSTVSDAVGNEDISLQNSPTWDESVGTWIQDWILRFNGLGEYGTSTASIPSGSMTTAVTIDFSSNITDIQAVNNFGPSDTTMGQGSRLLRFRGDVTTNMIEFQIGNDGGSGFDVGYNLPSAGTYRVLGILDTSASEIRIAVNGTVQNTTPISGSYSNQNTDHMIARRVDGSSRHYGGGIDEPLVANEAWDSTQITDDYNRQPWS